MAQPQQQQQQWQNSEHEHESGHSAVVSQQFQRNANANPNPNPNAANTNANLNTNIHANANIGYTSAIGSVSNVLALSLSETLSVSIDGNGAAATPTAAAAAAAASLSTTENRIITRSRTAGIVAGNVGGGCACDHCQIDLSQTIRIRCAECDDLELCLQCFANGVEIRGDRTLDAENENEKDEENQMATDTANASKINSTPLHTALQPNANQLVPAISSSPPLTLSSSSSSSSSASASSGAFCHLRSHAYRVVHPLRFPLFEHGWNADEEELLLEAIELKGFGNWSDIAAHVGSKTKAKCEEHYWRIYFNSPNCPLPNTSEKLLDETETQTIVEEAKDLLANHTEISDADDAKKKNAKNRKNARSKLAARQAPAASNINAAALSAIIASNPTVHSYVAPSLTVHWQPSQPKPKSGVALTLGFVPNRGDFDQEYENEFEILINDMEFRDDDTNMEKQIKLKMLHIYNQRLDARIERKTFILQRGLLNEKTTLNTNSASANSTQTHSALSPPFTTQLGSPFNSSTSASSSASASSSQASASAASSSVYWSASDSSREERERERVIEKLKVIARFLTAEEFDEFVVSAVADEKTKSAILFLQQLRKNGVKSLRDAHFYEMEKRRRDNPQFYEQPNNQFTFSSTSSMDSFLYTTGSASAAAASSLPALWADNSDDFLGGQSGQTNATFQNRKRSLEDNWTHNSEQQRKKSRADSIAIGAQSHTHGNGQVSSPSPALSIGGMSAPKASPHISAALSVSSQFSTFLSALPLLILENAPSLDSNLADRSPSFDISLMENADLLSARERQLCTDICLLPTHYLAVKHKCLVEYFTRGSLSLKQAKAVCKLEGNRLGKVHSFFLEQKWVSSVKRALHTEKEKEKVESKDKDKEKEKEKDSKEKNDDHANSGNAQTTVKKESNNNGTQSAPANVASSAATPAASSVHAPSHARAQSQTNATHNAAAPVVTGQLNT